MSVTHAKEEALQQPAECNLANGPSPRRHASARIRSGSTRDEGLGLVARRTGNGKQTLDGLGSNVKWWTCFGNAGRGAAR